MKKLLCAVIIFVMVFSSFAAYADTETLFAAWEKAPLSANTHSEFSIKLNKPFDFINELMSEDELEYMPVDVKQLAESACSVTETADMTYSMSEDNKKIQIAASTEVTLPLQFCDNFKADIWAQIGLWLDADLTDENNPYFKAIYKVPFSNKYLVLDYADAIETDAFSAEEFIDSIKKYNDPEMKKELFDFFKTLIEEHMTIKETSNNREYVITADDKGFKNIIKAFAEKYFEDINGALGVQEEIDGGDYRYQFEQYLSVLDEFQILGKNGLKLKVSLQGGKISVSDFSLHIDFNLHDAITAFGGDMSDYNRENWWLDFTLLAKTTYENVNQNITVTFPELTEENSMNVFEDDYSYSSAYDYLYVNTKSAEPDSNGNFVLPLKDAMMGFKIAKRYYSVEGDKIVITPREGQYDFTTAEMTVGSDILTVDGVQTTLYTTVTKDENGVVYIPVDAVTTMTGYVIDDLHHYFGDNGYDEDTVWFYKMNPEDEEEEEDIYISRYMYIYGVGDPVMVNDELYLPLRDTVLELSIPEENISVENGQIIITNDNENVPEFTELKLTEFSRYVYVNSQKYVLDNPVVERGGKAYIPAQLMLILGCSVSEITYYFTNPAYYSIECYRMLVDYEDDYEDDWQPKNNTLYIQENNAPVKIDGEYYLPLWPTMGELGVRGDDIAESGDSAMITSEKPETGFKTLVISGASVIMDGTEYTMSKPMVMVNDKNYIPLDFITSIMGGTVDDLYVVYYEDGLSYRFYASVPNPLYVEPVEE